MTSANRIAALSRIRVDAAERVTRAMKERHQRSSPLVPNGKTLVIGADHAARGAMRAGACPLPIADRHRLLIRLCVALARPAVNVVLGTTSGSCSGAPPTRPTSTSELT